MLDNLLHRCAKHGARLVETALYLGMALNRILFKAYRIISHLDRVIPSHTPDKIKITEYRIRQLNPELRIPDVCTIPPMGYPLTCIPRT